MDSNKLIEDLIERTQVNIQEIEQLQSLPFELLNHKVFEKAWSALECIQHLNYYGNFYLPEIAKRIKAANSSKGLKPFQSSWLGSCFAKSMLPKEKLNKMKTFKSMNPAGSNLSKDVLTVFVAQQKEMLSLLEQARVVDLTKTKTAISISKIIKLRLGDTFRVVIYHNQRHIVQARKAVESYG